MQSKTSFFNPTLFKKNLARFWPLWGGASVIGALVPLYALTELIQSGFRSHAGQALELTAGYYYSLAYVVPIISLFYAALCALAVWHYLYNARSVGMYHSLPITRKGLFVTNFLSGMAMMLIPYAVTGGIAVLISIAAGLFDPAGVLVTILGVIGESFFYFAAATLIVFVTGNPFAFAAFYFIFHFLAAGAEWLVTELVNEFYFGVSLSYQGLTAFLSPTIYLWEKVGAYAVHEQTIGDGWVEYGSIESVALLNGHLIAVYALVGAALLGCAWLLYQRRRSESAGDVVAVGWMKPVFRYGVALCAALSGGTLLYNIFCAGFQNRFTASAVPMAVCMAIAGVVGYYIASMLLAKSLKVFRRSGKGVLAAIIASAAVCLLIAADPFGVEARVPEAGEVNSVSVSFYSYDNYGRWASADSLTDPAVIQKILDMHQAIVAERDSLDRESSSLWEDGYVSLRLYYGLTDGAAFSRKYSLSCAPELLARSEALQLAQEVVTDPAVQEENIFGEIGEHYNVVSARLTSGYIGDLYNTATQEIEGLDLTLDQAKEVEAAIRRDIQAGHFGKTLFMTDQDQYARAAFYGDIQLNYNITRQYDDQTVNEQSRTIFLGISTYCTETLKALEDIGAVDSTHKLLTLAERDALELREDGRYYENPYSYYYDDSLLGETVYFPDGASVTVEELS